MQIERERRRARYLAALGIERWVSRSSAGVAQTQAQVSVETELAAPVVRSSAIASPAIAAPTIASPAIAGDWQALVPQVTGCHRCALHAGRTHAVFGVGNREAEWMVVGEAPGSEEDKRGEPFVGAAGQLLTAMLAAIHLPREQAFITNVLKCRPPENRDPRPDEIAQCLPYLQRQIELVKPKLILAFGRIAAHNLLSLDQPLSRLRGRLHHVPDLGTPVVVTYHPAYLLRVPADKRKAWEDLKFARRVFEALPS